MKRGIFLLLFPVLLFAQMNLNNNTVKIGVSGDVKYGFVHAVGSADSINVTLTVTQYLYKKIAGTGITWKEADGVTCAADSVTIVTAGDYEVYMSITMSGANAGDQWRIKMFKNNAAFPTSVGRFAFYTKTNGQADTKNFKWYLADLSANDVLSWRITNYTASRNPTITDLKYIIKKIPE